MAIRDWVIQFVKRHDTNSQNDTAELISENQVTKILAQEYDATVLNHIQNNDISGFHAANAVLFDYIPPAKRSQFLFFLQGVCSHTDSALAGAFSGSLNPFHPQTCEFVIGFEGYAQCVVDNETDSILRQIQNLNAIPPITATNRPDLYQKISWLIGAWQSIGETTLAAQLQNALNDGKLRYLANLKIADAYADPRDGSIVFSEKFFTDTWQNVITQKNNNDLIYKKYFGDLPENTFPPTTPIWVIMIAHELRHVQQRQQDLTDSKPNWAKNANLAGIAYYRVLNLEIQKLCYNHPEAASSQNRINELKNEIGENDVKIDSAIEAEATKYAITIGKKTLKTYPTLSSPPTP